MGFFDDIFGGFFDFNGDGKTSWDEEWIAYKIMQDIEKEYKKENGSYDASLLDDDELDDLMDEYEEEFNSALVDGENVENDEWRLYADENNYGVDPYDYDTEEEYLSAVEEAETDESDGDKSTTEGSINVPIKLNFSVEFPALDDFDSIKESDFPNKRLYNAAVYKLKLKKGFIIGVDKKTKENEHKRCDFILQHHDNCLAANYLSTQFGEFLYTQAVKEHFNLPFSVPDEDEDVITPISDLFRQIHKNCKEQLFPIWNWLVEQFVPFMEYSSDNGYSLSSDLISNGDFIDDAFLNELADYIAKNKDFGKSIISLSPSLDNEYGTLFAILLKKNFTEFTTALFKICADKKIDSSNITAVIYGLMEGCSNYEELETMERFEQNIFPIVKGINNRDVQKNISAWEEEIKDYYSYCEENCEQYQFTRNNSWRNKYKNDAEALGLSVTDYDAEDAFLIDYNEEKYGWRGNYSTDDTYGLNPSDFETEEELTEAIENIIEQGEKQSEEKYDNAEANIASESCENDDISNVFNDNTIYTYIGVMFPYASHPYHYLTDDNSIEIGDSVIVPVGIDNKEMAAKVVSVEKHLRVSAPFPVEKTKKVIRKDTEANVPYNKIRLISNNVCYGPMTEPDEEFEQHLTILSDGRVWFSRYAFGDGFNGKNKLIEKKQLNIGKESATEILSYIKNYFDKKGLMLRCTDVGVWELFVTNENGFKTVILGSLISDDYTTEISEHLREKLPIDNIFLFDGNVNNESDD